MRWTHAGDLGCRQLHAGDLGCRQLHAGDLGCRQLHVDDQEVLGLQTENECVMRQPKKKNPRPITVLTSLFPLHETITDRFDIVLQYVFLSRACGRVS
jgi:hypothetical protein